MATLKWDELTRACLSMELGVIGNNLSMISDFKAKDGLSEEEWLSNLQKPTYRIEPEFHAIQCWTCLQKIQGFIVTADRVFDPKDKSGDLFLLLQQAFKGTVLDAANCIIGVLAIIQEISGKKMLSTEEAGDYLIKRFPNADDDFSVFKSPTINTLALLGAVLIQQRGRLRIFGGENFRFSVEDMNSDNIYLEPRKMCLSNGLVNVIPYLFVLLLHVAKCLDLAIKYYLLANSDPETYEEAAKWYATPEEFEINTNDKLPEALAKVFEKHSIDIKLFADLMNAG